MPLNQLTRMIDFKLIESLSDEFEPAIEISKRVKMTLPTTAKSLGRIAYKKQIAKREVYYKDKWGNGHIRSEYKKIVKGEN